jgi:hypothetical protein
MFFAFLIHSFYEIKTEWTWLLRPVNFILLIGLYRFKLFNKIKFFFILGIYIVIAIKVEQRMEFLFLFLVLGFLLIDKIFKSKIKKKFLKYIIASFIIIFSLVFTVGYEFISNIIASIIDFQDSRTFLFTELFEDLSFGEKIYGRGSLGTYFSEFFAGTRRYYEAMGNMGWRGDSPIRITTEVGYLQMILKGGFILLILNVLIALYSIYLALFNSKNKFVKRLGYYILILSILSLVSFRSAFTPMFIIFWTAIGTVLNKNYRAMNDEEINKLIKF